MQKDFCNRRDRSLPLQDKLYLPVGFFVCFGSVTLDQHIRALSRLPQGKADHFFLPFFTFYHHQWTLGGYSSQGTEAPPWNHHIVFTLRDWSLITGRGGYKMGKSRVRNLLCPPSRQGKTFPPPPFKEWKLFVPPSIWLKLQATA